MSELWSQCLSLLRDKVNDHSFTIWLEPMKCESVSDTEVVLSAPSNFFISWIKDNYITLIIESLRQLSGRKYEILFVSRGDLGTQLPEESHSTNKVPGPGPGSLSTTVGGKLPTNLNSNYTFDKFVVGGCNQLAKAAAMAVSENLGTTYNPLFLYGGTGLGKTHLMSATGHAVRSMNKTKKVSFATSEEFTNEMINAIRFDHMEGFREKYRNVDLLMIDDIQFLKGKERTQEEFFHTFNSVCENAKQIVISSDRPPHEIKDIDHRLRSRFSSGLIANLGVPDLETRVAILKRKGYDTSIELPDDVAYFLAERVKDNIRELTGCLIRVIAMSTLQGIPISIDLAQQAVDDITPRHAKKVTIDDIINAVAKAYNVKASDLKSKKKHKRYSLPRQLAMYLARELTEYSFPEIGAAFGGKDHSTVIYATRKIEKIMETDHALKLTVEALKKDIRG